jgi:hypothetical protein
VADVLRPFHRCRIVRGAGGPVLAARRWRTHTSRGLDPGNCRDALLAGARAADELVSGAGGRLARRALAKGGAGAESNQRHADFQTCVSQVHQARSWGSEKTPTASQVLSGLLESDYADACQTCVVSLEFTESGHSVSELLPINARALLSQRRQVPKR